MEALWNIINLERPPNVTWRIESTNFHTKPFLTTVNTIIKDIDSHESLNQEAAMLSRLIYRMKTKFRNDKGLKNMEKVNKALLRYLTLALDKEYKSLKSYVEEEGKFVALPSRQMVEYVLIRTLGYGKLMSRVEQVSNLGAKHFKARVNSGQAWTISLVAYAVLCRIWILSRHIITKCCIWYDSLYRHLKNFEAVGVPWLSTAQELPSNMKSWIQLPWMDENVMSTSNETEWKDPMFKLLTTQTGNGEDDDAMIIDEEKTHVQKNVNDSLDATTRVAKSQISNVQYNDEDDLGEVVDRDAFKLSQMKIETEKINPTKQESDSSMDSENDGTSNSKEIDAMQNLRKDTECGSLHLKMKRLAKCIKLKRVSMADDVSVKLELIDILNKDSYPGLDKLQWNIIKNKSKCYLNKVDKTPDNKKKIALLRKLVCTIESCIK